MNDLFPSIIILVIAIWSSMAAWCSVINKQLGRIVERLDKIIEEVVNLEADRSKG